MTQENTPFEDLEIDSPGLSPISNSEQAARDILTPSFEGNVSEPGRLPKSMALNTPEQKTLSGGNNLLNVKSIMEDWARIKAGEIVADFGCGGNAYYVMQAAKLVGARGKVYPVDVDKKMLEMVISKCNADGIYNVEPVWTDLEMYGVTRLKPDSIDVGLAINIFYQSTKRSEMFLEMHRLIAPGGRLIIVDWASKADAFGPPLEQRVKKSELIALAQKTGYTLAAEFEPGEYHFGLLLVDN